MSGNGRLRARRSDDLSAGQGLGLPKTLAFAVASTVAKGAHSVTVTRSRSTVRIECDCAVVEIAESSFPAVAALAFVAGSVLGLGLGWLL